MDRSKVFICCVLLLSVLGRVVPQQCVVVNFEDMVEEDLLLEQANCEPHEAWSLFSYSNGTEPPTPQATSYIRPQESMSCFSTVNFLMESGGTIEIKYIVFADGEGLTASLAVIVYELIDGISVFVKNRLVTENAEDWRILELSVPPRGSDYLNGYVTLMGISSVGATVMVDSIRYIPLDIETDSCLIYTPVTEAPTEAPTTVSTTETPTEATTTEDATTQLTDTPTEAPTTEDATTQPTETPTEAPTTEDATTQPTETPTEALTTGNPTGQTTETPTEAPTTGNPTGEPTGAPTEAPTTGNPTGEPTGALTEAPTTGNPTGEPTGAPTEAPVTGDATVETTTVVPAIIGPSFWNPYTISMVVISCVVVFCVLGFVFYDFGKRKAATQLAPIIIDDFENLPKPSMVPRVKSVYESSTIESFGRNNNYP